jgi:methyl-accepting chemotaxis protein
MKIARTTSATIIRDVVGTMLHQRIVFAIGAVAFIVVAAVTWAADLWLRDLLRGLPAEQVADARMGVLMGAVILLSLLLVSLTLVSRFVLRSVTGPAMRLASLAETVANGDLTVTVPGTESDDEMGRLSRATEGMLEELRRLATAINESTYRGSLMAAEITGGTGQMTVAAAEIAQTANDLSVQSTEMADTVRQTVQDVASLQRIAGQLTSGARGGVERNARLRELARENRGRLNASREAFDRLTGEARTGAASADALAQASEEIRAFLTLVRKITRQSKLLALNASMEAARAGDVGEGFAVVATEIRKMAAGTADAAERTQHVVDDVLARVADTRASSQRTLATVEDARQATSDVMQAFTQVEDMVGDMDGWIASIERAAGESAQVVESTRERLDQLARGIESFAAAMQEVAASSEEQSASTQEIAAAAAALATSSRELSRLVAAFRLERRPAHAPLPAPQSPAPGAPGTPALAYTTP